MREIKFRAVMEYEEGFLYGNPIGDGYGNFKFMKPFNNIVLKTTSKIDLVKIKEETLSQYTGLKDKNGVEMFEGDIIEHYGEKNIVCYVESKLQFRGEHIKYGPNWTTELNDRFEVIGNIFQNKNLLEVE